MIHDRSETSLWYRTITCAPLQSFFTATRRHRTTSSSEAKRKKETQRKGGKWEALWSAAVVLRLEPAGTSLFPRVVNNRKLSSQRCRRVAHANATRRVVRALLGIGFGNLCRTDKFYQASVANVARPRPPVNHAELVMLSPRAAIRGRFPRTRTDLVYRSVDS